MSRNLQYLPLILCLVMVCNALSREETLEERKKRIARRYLHERGTIDHSIAEVPVEPDPEKEALMKEDSTKYTDGINRQPSVLLPLNPVRRPRPRKTKDRNWLLEEKTGDEVGTDQKKTENPFNWFSDKLLPDKQILDYVKPQTGAELFSRPDSGQKDQKKDKIRYPGNDDSRASTLRRHRYGWETKSGNSFGADRIGGQTGRESLFNGRKSKNKPSYQVPNYGSRSTDKPALPLYSEKALDSSPYKTGNSLRIGPRYRLYEGQTVRQPYRSSSKLDEDNRGIGTKQVRPYEQWKKSFRDPMEDHSYLNEVMPKLNHP